MSHPYSGLHVPIKVRRIFSAQWFIHFTLFPIVIWLLFDAVSSKFYIVSLNNALGNFAFVFVLLRVLVAGHYNHLSITLCWQFWQLNSLLLTVFSACLPMRFHILWHLTGCCFYWRSPIILFGFLFSSSLQYVVLLSLPCTPWYLQKCPLEYKCPWLGIRRVIKWHNIDGINRKIDSTEGFPKVTCLWFAVSQNNKANNNWALFVLSPNWIIVISWT